MPAPVGATVTIAPYDFGRDDGPQPGDIIVSYSERMETWGTAYRIVSTRLMARSSHPGRYSLRCEVMGKFEDVEHETVPGARFFTIVWNRRDRRKR